VEFDTFEIDEDFAPELCYTMACFVADVLASLAVALRSGTPFLLPQREGIARGYRLVKPPTPWSIKF